MACPRMKVKSAALVLYHKQWGPERFHRDEQLLDINACHCHSALLHAHSAFYSALNIQLTPIRFGTTVLVPEREPRVWKHKTRAGTAWERSEQRFSDFFFCGYRWTWFFRFGFFCFLFFVFCFLILCIFHFGQTETNYRIVMRH
ncbi:uncharacterized protein YALI1_E37441g [Yarrowia lipolytica]|uniref:Uncharacterized protein n=1 Tax=Yarrowia lipolytica TaxID=4952 RepID=A0A1D8NKS4_YARLL|nr:hypothetical protein YALI1_E37441g [Yarrowia lipolytica]